MTLRARLVAILAVLIIAGLLVSGVATYSALQDFLYERVDSQLRQTQALAIGALRIRDDFPRPPRGGPAGLPISAYAELRNQSGEVVESVAFGFEGTETNFVPDIRDSRDLSTSDAPFTVGAVEEPSYAFRVLATQFVDGETLIVAIPLADAQDTLQRLLMIEVIVAVVLLGAIATSAWLLIRRELRPLDQMADAATEIAAGDLSRRVDEADPRTEVGRLGRALNRMMEQIEQSFEARRASEEGLRRFLADASHELRTPLTSIRGYAELFRLGADERPEDLRLSMRRIEEEAARMGLLVEDLLLLSDADRTRPFANDPVDLTRLMRDAFDDARVRDPNRPISIESEEGVVVRGDEDRLRQAVGNLMANALDHTPAGTEVILRLSTRDRTALVVVEDRGPGLDEETLEHAFERFWRRDPSRTRETGGAGLGLSIVEAIARGHDGSVAAESLESGGARFIIRIPMNSQETNGPVPAPSQVDGPG